MLVWNPAAILGIVSAVTLLGVGSAILVARPAAVPNRRLAALMSMEALVIFTFGGATFLVSEARAAYALMALGYGAVAFKFYAYLMFLSTLPTRSAAWMGRPWARLGLLAATTFVALTWLLDRSFYVAGAEAGPGGVGWHIVPGDGFTVLLVFWAIVWLSALGFSVRAYIKAKTTTGKRVARGYLVGFTFRDVTFQSVALGVLIAGPGAAVTGLLMGVVVPLIYTIYPLLLGYSLLKYHLFDIDVKIRFAVKQSTLAAIGLLAFFVVKELAENLVADSLGLGLGIGAALILAYMTRPVQTMADKLANNAVPAADAALRKEEVYRAAVEGAIQDGTVTSRESTLIQNLRRQLDLSAARARSLEAEVRAAFSA